MVITLDPKLEAALKESARRQRVSPESLALAALRERFLAAPPVDESQDDWLRRLRGVATDCGVSLSDKDGSSEELYE